MTTSVVNLDLSFFIVWKLFLNASLIMAFLKLETL